MTGITRLPVRRSSWVAGGAGALALIASGFYSWPAVAVATLGLVLLGVGLALGVTAGVTVGAFGLVLAALVAGLQGAPVLAVVFSVAAAVVAWDLGGTAVVLGEQLGREADTRRLEAVRIAASTGVGALTIGAGYGLYRVATGGQPAGALAFLLIAAVLLVVALE